MHLVWQSLCLFTHVIKTSLSMIWRLRIYTAIHINAGRDFTGSQLVTILVFESCVQGDNLASFIFSCMFFCSSLIVFPPLSLSVP